MGSTINNRDFVDTETIKAYNEIDFYVVLKELLLTKGEQIAQDYYHVGSVSEIKYRCVYKKDVEDFTLVYYGLKSNATNKLNIGFKLDKFALRESLARDKNSLLIVVPENIYNEAKQENDKYRKQHEPNNQENKGNS